MSPAFVTRESCPCCGSAEQRLLFERPLEEARLRGALEAFYARVGALDYEALRGGTYRVLRCQRCTLVYQSEIPGDGLLARLYEEWISPELARQRFHQGHAPHQLAALEREALLAAGLLDGAAPRRTLDYGCGWGEWLAELMKLGFEPWGTELSETRRRHAQGLGVNVVADQDLPDDHFGLINIDQVLEHVPSPRGTLALLAAKLHDRGVLRLGVPNGRWIERGLRRFDRELTHPRLGRLNPAAPLEHLNCFNTESLVRLAADLGLERVRPSWALLLRTRQRPAPPGARARLKNMARPFYLRSDWTTQLYFRRAEKSRVLRPRAARQLGPDSNTAVSGTSEPQPGRAALGAVVVTFNADPHLPTRLDLLRRQVDLLLVCDNSLDASAREHARLAAAGAGALFLPQARNLGVAGALNAGFRLLVERGCTLAIALDQDSTPAPDLAEVLSSGQGPRPQEGPAFAVLGSNWHDEGAPGQPPRLVRPLSWLPLCFQRVLPDTQGNEPAPASFVIMSGACFDLGAWTRLGGFDESLMLDLVDIDYCLRAKSAGLQVALHPKARLAHNRGAKRAVRRFGRTWHPSFMSPRRLRCLFHNRTRVLLPWLFSHPHMACHELAHTAKLVLEICLLEDGTGAKLAGIVRGIRDGALGRPLVL